MKKAKTLIFPLATIILVNAFFLIILLFYNDIIIVPSPFFKNVSKEYWYWYTSRSITNFEDALISITFLLNLLCTIILLAQFLYIIFEKKYKDLIERRYIIVVIFIGTIIYWSSFLFIKYKVEHYRLFMTLSPAVVLSMMLLCIVLMVKKRLKD